MLPYYQLISFDFINLLPIIAKCYQNKSTNKSEIVIPFLKLKDHVYFGSFTGFISPRPITWD